MRVSPRMIFEELDKYVLGQEEGKRMLSILMFFHVVRTMQKNLEGRCPTDLGCGLLMGPTGCGKTLMVREASKAVRRISGLDICPVIELDATSITAKGWHGNDADEEIKKKAFEIYKAGSYSYQSAIVFMDEFDKICMPAPSTSATRDYNKNTQYSLLKLVEGVKLSCNDLNIDTSSMLFVFAGNFPDIRKIRDTPEKGVGFTNSLETARKQTAYQRELSKFGMSTQLVGRCSHIAELQRLSREDLQSILYRFVLPKFNATWEFLDDRPYINKAMLDNVLDRCVEAKTGARGLAGELSKELEDQAFDLILEL